MTKKCKESPYFCYTCEIFQGCECIFAEMALTTAKINARNSVGEKLGNPFDAQFSSSLPSPILISSEHDEIFSIFFCLWACQFACLHSLPPDTSGGKENENVRGNNCVASPPSLPVPPPHPFGSFTPIRRAFWDRSRERIFVWEKVISHVLTLISPYSFVLKENLCLSKYISPSSIPEIDELRCHFRTSLKVGSSKEEKLLNFVYGSTRWWRFLLTQGLLVIAPNRSALLCDEAASMFEALRLNSFSPLWMHLLRWVSSDCWEGEWANDKLTPVGGERGKKKLFNTAQADPRHRDLWCRPLSF